MTGWKKPVAYQLVSDVGFTSYKSTLSVRSADLEKNSACLERLVPVVQQAQKDFMASPDQANGVIIDAVEAYDTGWVYGKENADFAVEAMKNLGIVGNGANTTTGEFDMDRLQHMLDVTRPIFTKQGIDIPAELTPESLVTNEFIDSSIGFTN